MKHLFILALLPATIFAANPSFQQFDTNTFTVVDKVSIAVNTNVIDTVAARVVADTVVSNALSYSNALVYFVDPNGNDATAQPGNRSRPYQTLSAAATAHVPFSTIWVQSGTYLVSNTVLLKEGVTIQGFGATISNYCGPSVPCVQFTNDCTIRNLKIYDAPSTTNFTYLLYGKGNTAGSASFTNITIEGCDLWGFSDGLVLQPGAVIKTNPVQLIFRNNRVRGEWDNFLINNDAKLNLDIYGNVFEAVRSSPDTYPLESSQLAHNIELRTIGTNSTVRIYNNTFISRATNANNLWLDGRATSTVQVWGNFFRNHLNSTNIHVGHNGFGSGFGYGLTVTVGLNEMDGLAVAPTAGNGTIVYQPYNGSSITNIGTNSMDAVADTAYRNAPEGTFVLTLNGASTNQIMADASGGVSVAADERALKDAAGDTVFNWQSGTWGSGVTFPAGQLNGVVNLADTNGVTQPAYLVLSNNTVYWITIP